MNSFALPRLSWAAIAALCLAILACSNANSAGGGDTAAAVDDSQGGDGWVDSADTANDVSSDDAIVDVAAAQDLLGPQDVGANTDVGAVDAGCSEAGCPCSAADQCNSGVCVDSDSGKKCGQLCGAGCAASEQCVQVSGSSGDIVNVCVDAHPRLCEPCAADSDCNNVLGGANNRCTTYKDDSGSSLGSFCGVPCSDAQACPSGYACQATVSVGSVKSQQCVKTDLVCVCDQRATTLGLGTACSNASKDGTCGGKRSCGAAGLGACDAPNAAPETCNLIDDNCNGQTDEPGPGVCNDNLPCTYDNCIAGNCQHPPTTGTCDDGSACTAGDECNNGKCVGSPVTCDDKNPCTKDSCDPSTGCLATADDASTCSDGNLCTTNDLCQSGACLPGSATVCDDTNGCTTDSCNPKTGCVFTANSADCSDGDVCTGGDLCQAGVCVPGAMINCSDGNPCSDDNCSAKSGCVYTSNSAACNDGNACTMGDICADSTCQGLGSKTCDDGNPCTSDGCDPTKGCVFTKNVAPCDDGNACTLNDACADGNCQGGKSLACVDGNPCTDDGCDGSKGCVYSSNLGVCDDNNPCTIGDSCQSGKCLPGVTKVCSDGNPCTDDSCDAIAGCIYTNNTSLCSDGNACTLVDSCAAGVCNGSAPLNCDDGNLCTNDSCDKASGCSHIANGNLCEDGNPCTVGDLCAAKLCVAGAIKTCDDGKACTTDVCDGTKGCLSFNNSAPCDDGSACTSGDACSGGTCAAGKPVVCDDSNPCTDDSCDVAKGCKNTPNTVACNDANACTSGDICSGGKCGGAAVNCDDGKACTADSCDAAKGCLNTVIPGIAEICGNSIDDNCDGQTDEGCGAAVCGPNLLTDPQQVQPGWTLCYLNGAATPALKNAPCNQLFNSAGKTYGCWHGNSTFPHENNNNMIQNACSPNIQNTTTYWSWAGDTHILTVCVKN